eukprot:TRINITY_DN51340_c0_g1_i1.p1 TRINITY_DN51340_c0_g1~~TRINITY_DN51340_c0_g1_i1.p1  ORF type:complete len:144 (+),score=34.88 TRINITY_DN51340_c0_g1_i1:230-661(+)
MLGFRGWEIEVENFKDGSRQSRAVCWIEPQDYDRRRALARVKTPWRYRRSQAEEDAEEVSKGYCDGGYNLAKQVAKHFAAEVEKAGNSQAPAAEAQSRGEAAASAAHRPFAPSLPPDATGACSTEEQLKRETPRKCEAPEDVS